MNKMVAEIKLTNYKVYPAFMGVCAVQEMLEKKLEFH